MSHDFSLFNSVNFPVCVIGPDGDLSFFNDLFNEVVVGDGRTASLDFQHPFYPEYRKRIANAYQKARDGEGTKCFAVIRAATGNHVPFEIYLYPVSDDSTKSSILVFFISVDNRLASFDDYVIPSGGGEISENINLFEFSPFPILRFDKKMSIIALSTSTEEMCGLPREDMIGDPSRFFNTLIPFDVERIKKSISDILNGDNTFKRVNDIKITTAKKEDKWANAVIYPVFHEKKKVIVELILEDITKIKFLENKVSALNKVQIIGDLTKGLLHSFNNFTNIILSRAQMILQITEKNSVIDGINIIHKAASEGAKQIRRVQDFISESDPHAALESADLIEIVEDAIEFTRIHFKVERQDKGRLVSVSKQYFAKERVRGQIKTLREIFVSMIFRAASLIDRQGVIETELRREEDLILSVSTTFADQRILDALIGATPLTEIEIRRVAEKINVRIFEEVSADRYLIKAVIPSAMIVGPEKTAQISDTTRLRDKDILVVEDEEALQEILFELFDSMGNRVSVCSGGEDALNEFRHSKYDIVIADYGLAGSTGLELLKKVRELNEKTATVLLSGWLIDDAKKYEKTVDLFLSKPFQLDVLIREISRILNREQLK